MSEGDVLRGRADKEKGPLSPHAAPAAGQGGVRNSPEPPERKADDEWLAFATEDPAFFIKPSDAL